MNSELDLNKIEQQSLKMLKLVSLIKESTKKEVNIALWHNGLLFCTDKHKNDKMEFQAKVTQRLTDYLNKITK